MHCGAHFKMFIVYCVCGKSKSATHFKMVIESVASIVQCACAKIKVFFSALHAHCKLVIESVTGAVTQQERDRGRHFQLSSTLHFNFQCGQFSTKIVNLDNLQYTTAQCRPLIFPWQSSRSAQRCISTEIFNLGNLHHCPPLIFPWHSSCQLHFKIYSPMAQFMSRYVAFKQ